MTSDKPCVKLLLIILSLLKMPNIHANQGSNTIENLLRAFQSDSKYCVLKLEFSSLNDIRLDFHRFHIASIPMKIAKQNPHLLTTEELGAVYKRRMETWTKLVPNIYRHYSSCETNVMIIRKVHQNNFGKNSGLNIFLGNSATLNVLFKTWALKRLKYKIGIATGMRTFHADVACCNDNMSTMENLVLSKSIRWSLFGCHFETVAMVVRGFVAFDVEKAVGGAFYNLIKEAGQTYNFTFNVQLNKGILSPLKNGSWGSGAFDSLLKNKKHMLLGAAVTVERFDVVDFTSAFGFVRQVFYTSHPSVHVKMYAIFYTYEKTVWILTCVGIFAFILVFYIAMSFYLENRSKALVHAIAIPFLVIFEQSYRVRIPGTKPFFVLLCVYSMVLGTGYKCNLISYLTFPEPDHVPSTFQELADEMEYKIQLASFKDAGYHFLQTTNVAKFATIRERYEITTDQLECLKDAALKKSSACIIWDIVCVPIVSMNLTVNRLNFPLKVSRDSGLVTAAALAFPKRFKFAQEFNLILGNLRDTGHFDKWENDLKDRDITIGIQWMKSRKGSQLYHRLYKTALRDSVVKPFKVENIAMTLFIIVFGLLGSMFVFGMEKISGLRTSLGKLNESSGLSGFDKKGNETNTKEAEEEEPSVNEACENVVEVRSKSGPSAPETPVQSLHPIHPRTI